MSQGLLHYLKSFSLIVLSSLLLVLSFPDFDMGFLAWIGLVPLLTAIHRETLKFSLLLSLFCGMLFFMGIFQWILIVPKYTLLHHTLLAVYLGSYFGLFGLAFSFVSKRLGVIPSLFSAPFIWVFLEYLRGNLSFLALPWGFLGHSQYQYPLVIQIASVAGTYSISFLIMMVNASTAAIVLLLAGVHSLPPSPPSKEEEIKPSGSAWRLGSLNRGTVALVILTLTMVVLTFAYGLWSIYSPLTGKKIKIGLIQGNIEQKKKWDPSYAREILQIYRELTEAASSDQPALIVWPETATPGAISGDVALHMQVRSIARTTGTHLLVGSAQYQKFERKESSGLKYLNSAFLIDPGTKVVRQQRYDKILLFPFGEYLPYRNIIPWEYINVRQTGEYVQGEDLTVFDHPGFRFSVTICWENIFPDLVRQFVKRGAQCIINVTNEAHFGKTAAPHQLAAISVFRAVENRVFVVRCANTGVSCIIDAHGRIIDRVKDSSGKDSFVRGILAGSVVPMDSHTFYTRYGDYWVWVSFAVSAYFIAWACFRRKNPSGSQI